MSSGVKSTMNNAVEIIITKARLEYLLEELKKPKDMRSPILNEKVTAGKGASHVTVKAE